MLKDRVRSDLFTFVRRTQWAYTLAQRLNRLRRPGWLGISRRTTPLSEYWGYDRGSPVDRYYIERFLAEHRYDIQGRVLEVKDEVYIDQLGVGVKQCEVLDIDPTNLRATIIADLAAADVIPSDHFDCFVCTQTLQYIYDIHAALAHIHRILRPEGVLLATVPCLCRVDTELSVTTGVSRKALVRSFLGMCLVLAKSPLPHGGMSWPLLPFSWVWHIRSYVSKTLTRKMKGSRLSLLCGQLRSDMLGRTPLTGGRAYSLLARMLCDRLGSIGSGRGRVRSRPRRFGSPHGEGTIL
jgi:SAM-dependent methyltransferase